MSSENQGHLGTLTGPLAKKALLVVLIILGIGVGVTPSAGVPTKPIALLVEKFTKHPDALPADEIVRLAQAARKTAGTTAVRRILGERNLPNEVLEDTYLRIAVSQQKLSRTEADGMFGRLSGTKGFTSTLSKIIGNSQAKTAGHLNELRIADAASVRGFRVTGIGLRFNDDRKAGATDIDLVLERKGTIVALEAKDYSPSTALPMDRFRADMESLERYVSTQRSGKIISVFSITNKPADSRAFRLLQLETERRGIQLIDGSPEAQIEQIKILCDIL